MPISGPLSIALFCSELLKDTEAYYMTHMCLGVVLNGESSYRQAVFTGRKVASSSQVVAIET